MSDDFIVAIGSVTDCEVLVEKFTKSTSAEYLSFADFANVWKSSHFELIFCCHSYGELPKLASELLTIGKNIILNMNNSLATRVGGLYLIYALYFKQTTKSKVRLTLSELKDLIIFLGELKDKNIKEAQFVFHKLFIGNAFLFCKTANEFIQVNPKRQSEEEVDMGDSMNENNECRLIECEGLSTNNLGDIDMLSTKYEEIKTQIPGLEIQNSSSAASNKDFVKDLLKDLNQLKSDIEKSKGSSTKQNKVASCTEAEAEENQGEFRRRLVNQSFQAQNGPYRLPAGGNATTSTRSQRKRAKK